MSVLSYLFIIIVSWIFARPLFALLLVTVWLAFVFIGKIAKDKFGNDGTQAENSSQNSNGNNNNPNYNGGHYNNNYTGKRIVQSFLGAH